MAVRLERLERLLEAVEDQEICLLAGGERSAHTHTVGAHGGGH